MSAAPYNPSSDYQPESIVRLPALYHWPFKPFAALSYVVFGMLFPWGHLYIALG